MTDPTAFQAAALGWFATLAVLIPALFLVLRQVIQHVRALQDELQGVHLRVNRVQKSVGMVKKSVDIVQETLDNGLIGTKMKMAMKEMKDEDTIARDAAAHPGTGMDSGLPGDDS